MFENFIKNLIPAAQDIKCTQWTLNEIPSADSINLLIEKNLVRLLEIDLPKEKNIETREQLRWHLHSLLEKPLEDYYYDFTIFTEDEQQIRALAGIIEKENADQLIQTCEKQNQSVEKIFSWDKQFVFYKKIILPWHKPLLLKRINALALISLVISLPLFLLVFIWLSLETQKINQQLNTAQAIYQQHQAKAAVAAWQKNTLQTIKQNQTSLKKQQEILYNLTAKTPEGIYFENLCLDKNNLQIQGQAANTNHIQKMLKQIRKISVLKEANLAKTGGTNSFQLETALAVPKKEKYVAKLDQ